MDDWSLELRVVYVDLPDMIELETRVMCGDWSAHARVYALPDFLREDAERLATWARNPEGAFRLKAGADPDRDWLAMKFYTIDAAKHARCAVTMVTAVPSGDTTCATTTWRFAIEMRTELGLIERFARECVGLGQDFVGVATLSGVPF